jgi:hypothetical protein
MKYGSSEVRVCLDMKYGTLDIGLTEQFYIAFESHCTNSVHLMHHSRTAKSYSAHNTL